MVLAGIKRDKLKRFFADSLHIRDRLIGILFLAENIGVE